MTGKQLVDDVPVREYAYDDGTVVYAADLEVVGEASVEVVDGTAIVVAGSEQYDIDLPEGDARAFIRNGVLTIEMTDEVDA
ncbi:MAG: hypothetical protein ABEJ89_07925 [Haloarculaceae archaeon]